MTFHQVGDDSYVMSGMTFHQVGDDAYFRSKLTSLPCQPDVIAGLTGNLSDYHSKRHTKLIINYLNEPTYKFVIKI